MRVSLLVHDMFFWLPCNPDRPVSPVVVVQGLRATQHTVSSPPGRRVGASQRQLSAHCMWCDEMSQDVLLFVHNKLTHKLHCCDLKFHC